MTDAQTAFANDLKTDLEANQVALMLGTGFSIATSGATTASWLGLLRSGLQYVKGLHTRDQKPVDAFLEMLDGDCGIDLTLTIAEYVRSRFDRIPGEYSAWLHSCFEHLTVKHRDLADALPDVNVVATTNYDSLVADALQRVPLPWTAPNFLPDASRSPQKYVAHLHGYYEDATSVILGARDYGAVGAHEALQGFLRNFVANHAVLFIGCGVAGLDDPNFRPLLSWMKENLGSARHRHYLLANANELAEINTEVLLEARITPVNYGPDHTHLPGFLARLSPERTDPHEARSQTRPATHDEGGYSSLLQTKLPHAIEVELERRLGLATSLGDFQTAALRCCADLIATGRSGLLSAVTGTGKTTIARAAINLAVLSKQGGIELLPIKALVAQEYKEWNSWADVWENGVGNPIRVYPSSRDYPENDRPVSRGRYDVALAIYEKLGVYLVSGRTPLVNTAVAVIDELQIMAESSQRGARLEALLTSILMTQSEQRPAILGLTATLPPSAAQTLVKWLDIPTANVITSHVRPVPLDTYVVDATTWMLQTDSHLFTMPGDSLPGQVKTERHSLDETVARNRPTLRGKLPHLPNGELAAALIDKILEGDSTRKIICFVPSRTAALELSTAIHALLKIRMGTSRKGSPWTVGRFAPTEAVLDSDERYRELRYSDIPNADIVIRGLREGVAAHTASFAAPLRRLIETEFRSPTGLLRVLIATDTLAMGVNLPADTVISTSISGYTGNPRRKRLLPPSNLDNKGGRAGRLGETKRTRGEFFILVPGRKELQEVEGATASDVVKLTTADGVCDRYVRAKERGSSITSYYRDLPTISSLVLQILCQDGIGRAEDKWLSRVEQILGGLLYAQEADALLPRAAEVLNLLELESLVGRRTSGKIALTGLGVALSRSGLELEAAPTLERLARLASANAGVIDLLWNACRSHSIQITTEWISLPPVPARHMPSLKEAVLRMARSYCAGTELQRRQSSLDPSTNYPSPEPLILEGSVIASPELTDLLQKDGETASSADVTALLRALVAFEWSRGLPFGQIKARYASAVVSEEQARGEAPVHVRLHYSDVEQLCEQIAGLLSSVAEVCVSQDNLDYSVMVRSLALEVECGLPAWVAPIVRMRVPGLHRERLTFLWDRSEPLESLGAVLDLDELRDSKGLSAADITRAKGVIEQRESEDREYRNRVASRFSTVGIPGGEGNTFEDLSELLDASPASLDYLRHLAELFVACGVTVDGPRTQDYFSILSLSSENKYVRLFVPHVALSPQALSAVRLEEGIVILNSRVLPGTFSTKSTPTRVRLVQPEHILTMIASLVQSREAGLNPSELVDYLSRLRVSSLDADSWSLYDPEGVGAPPPFSGEMPSLREFEPPVQADDTMLE